MMSYSKYPFLMITLIRLLVGGLVVYLILCVFMVLYQDRLLFLRRDLPEERVRALQDSPFEVEEISFATPEGITLNGWWVNREQAALRNEAGGGKVPVVFFFGGNAEEVSHMVWEASSHPDWSFVLMNYRGYGRSEGSPEEEALLQDSLLIYDYAAQRDTMDPERTVVMGRSLGTGVAAYLASQQEISAALLISPYDSMVQVAQDAYPFLPVNRLMRHRFEVLPYARQVDIPLYAIIALRDEVIAVKRSQALLESWGGEVFLTEVPHAGHNTLAATAAYDRFLKESLGEIYSSE